MITIKRVDSDDADFTALVKSLDVELAQIDGEEHAFYAQYNKIDKRNHAVVVYAEGTPVACGAIKELEPGIMEVKRMYTIPSYRGKGAATQVLRELEAWAAGMGYQKCCLETGKRQPDAIALYTKNGYKIIPNYGQYAGVENSVCFEKELT